MPIAQGSADSVATNGGNLSSAAGAAIGSAASAAAAPTTTTSSSAAAETASSKRLPNTTASLPIVYGSIAFYLGKKADELQTHEWTLFVRGPNPLEDHLNSLVISKVVFQLHPSFAQPTRELTEPPYEVTERGWGEFEAQIRIHWKDPSEQTTIVNHTIKLYPQGSPPASGSAKNDSQSTETPVVAETYDEVVFTDPTESFFRSLTQITAVPQDPAAVEEIASFAHTTTVTTTTNETQGDEKKSRSSTAATSSTPKVPLSSSWKDHLTTVYSDQEDFLALIAAQKFLHDELAGLKQRFRLVTDDLSVVDQKLLLAQQQKQREAAAAAVRGSAAGGAASGERKRTKKSRSTTGPKKARTSGGAGSKTPTTTSPAASKRAGGTARAGAKTGAKTTKAATAAAATKKGTSNSGGATAPTASSSSGTKK